jgi:predicted phage terminase large subunit-like protein
MKFLNTPEARREAVRLATLEVTVGDSPYIPHAPTPAQQRFLLTDNDECLYGGAAGGGKTDALLMAALQYVGTPGYAALLLRRTYGELTMPEGLIARAHEWLAGSPAVWNEAKKTYTFPSGAAIVFGYLDSDRDVYRYQGPAFQFMGFDELTQFSEFQYRWLFSRMRRLEGSAIPVRTRAASNPGGAGHEWVKHRFVKPGHPDRPFIPAKLADNPFLDAEEYVRRLEMLDPVTRAQMLEGDWDVAPQGAMFQREWFGVPMDEAPAKGRRCRAWDLAGTEAKKSTDPDYTVGLRLCKAGGVYYIEHVVRVRRTPGDVEKLVSQCGETDGACQIRMEQEPGQSGKAQIRHYRTNVIPHCDFRGVANTGSKATRAAPVASAAEAGNIRMVRGEWNGKFLDEIASFPIGKHDDQVDALSLAYQTLAKPSSGFAV